MPPILNLLYDYDENGVLRKRKNDINNTMITIDDPIFYLENNESIVWNASKNESLNMEDFLELQEYLAGNNFGTLRKAN